MRSPSRPVARFVGLIRETTGNVIPQARYGFLEELLERRARVTGQPDVTSYLHRLAACELDAEWAQLISLITIKESYFFRAPQQFEALRQVLLPSLLRSRAHSRKLRFWSAACAHGEEPSTLAMVLAETGALGSWDWRIVATDVDREALAAAERGLYGERAVSRVPRDLLERHFTRRGKLFELSPAVRARIRYLPLNLTRPAYIMDDEAFDVVFLRNVLIYFPRPLQRRVATQATRLLEPGGFLFLGASETLWQIHDRLRPLDLGACFCYQRPRPGEEPPAPVPRPPTRRPVPLPKPRPKPEARPEPLPEPEVRPEPEPAVEVAAEPPAPAPCSVQEHLVEAARALANNRLEEASRALEEAVAADPSEPAVYALEGFLRDLEGKADEAVASYRAALYLDPALYQARLLLADCLLRMGYADRACQHCQEVLATLDSGREVPALEDLLPSRRRAEWRCREVLRRGGR